MDKNKLIRDLIYEEGYADSKGGLGAAVVGGALLVGMGTFNYKIAK